MKFQQIAAKGVIGAATACTVGAIVSAAAPASALVVQWNFTAPAVTSGPFTASTVDPNATASQLFGNGGGQFVTNGSLGYFAGTRGAVNQATADSTNSNVVFNVAPKAGFVMNLTSITFKARNTNNNTGNIFLMSNRNSFATPVDGVRAINQLNPTALGDYTFNLSGFTNLTSSVQFQLRTFAPTAADNQQNIYNLDDITVNGTISPVATGVPFPFAPLPGIALTWGVSQFRRKLQAKQTMKTTVNA